MFILISSMKEGKEQTMKCLNEPTRKPSLMKLHSSQGKVLPFRKSVTSMKKVVSINISVIVNYTLNHRAHI